MTTFTMLGNQYNLFDCGSMSTANRVLKTASPEDRRQGRQELTRARKDLGMTDSRYQIYRASVAFPISYADWMEA